jgi:hypothetical protein
MYVYTLCIRSLLVLLPRLISLCKICYHQIELCQIGFQNKGQLSSCPFLIIQVLQVP